MLGDGSLCSIQRISSMHINFRASAYVWERDYEDLQKCSSAVCTCQLFKRPHAKAFLQTIVTLSLILVYVEMTGSNIHI